VKGAPEPLPAPADDFVVVAEEPTPIEENFEDESDAVEDESAADEQQAGDHEGAASSDEGEIGRRRRRRRRRRGGDRPFGESIAPDAPQPTDDGLAVVAEIGGDMQAPVGDADAFGRREPRSEGDRGRRSRRSRGGRNRFSPRPNDATLGETHPGGEAEAVEKEPAAGSTVSEVDLEAAQASAAEPSLEAWRAGEAAIVETERSAAPEQSSIEPEGNANRPAEPAQAPPETQPAPIASEPVHEQAPAPDEAPRPRRSGWWQRARASIVGE
jgi:ribonuclease E